MNKLILILLLWPLLSWGESLSDSNKLFDFAEQTYPEFFSPPGGKTYRLENYWVRYYPNTEVFIGTLDDKVYVYGEIFQGLLEVGRIQDFIDLGQDRDAILKDAFDSRLSDIQVTDSGTVIRLLTDDLSGDRRQRFILRLASGQTLLITHNIDLAPRIANLKVGEKVEFYGEYVWNEQGGLIHWTHYDPAGLHIDGWLMHNDTIYQSY